MTQDRPTWRIWLALWVAVAMQTTLLARWQPLGVHVDLPLLLVVSVALLAGAETGAIYGLAAGLLTGYCEGMHVGSFAVSRMAVGAAFGLFDRRFSRDNPLAPSLCAAGAVLFSNLIFGIMSPGDFSLAWWAQRTPIAMLLHAVLIYPLHWITVRLLLPPERSMFA